MKEYESLEMEIIWFENEDVITTSGEDYSRGDVETPEEPIGGQN